MSLKMFSGSRKVVPCVNSALNAPRSSRTFVTSTVNTSTVNTSTVDTSTVGDLEKLDEELLTNQLY